MSLTDCFLPLPRVALAGLFLLTAVAVSPLAESAHGADVPDAEKKAESKEKEDEAAEEPGPIEIPDGDAKELFQFITETMRNRGRTMEEAFRSARAVVDAAGKIRTLDEVEVGDQVRALRQQLPALQFLANYKKEARAELKDLLEELGKSDQPEIKKFAEMEAMKARIASVGRMTAKDRQALIDEVVAMFADGINIESYSIASRLARSLGSSTEPKKAAELYLKMADAMEASDDERLQERAEKERGSARRIQLLGNEMELVGSTAEGEPFDWSAYRGKVVLVDFWASWCGPCLGEIPNMKQALESYPEGFEIVGINMDRTNEAMEKCMEKYDIAWVNLVGDDEMGRGWDHPMATYYGVTGIPTAILVDQDGLVVSLSARGKRLNDKLQELLGPPRKPEVTEKEEGDSGKEDSAEGA